MNATPAVLADAPAGSRGVGEAIWTQRPRPVTGPDAVVRAAWDPVTPGEVSAARRHPATALEVVRRLDPGDDRQAELLAGGPAPAAEDVLLQQAEEELHGGVVRAGPDPAIELRSCAP